MYSAWHNYLLSAKNDFPYIPQPLHLKSKFSSYVIKSIIVFTWDIHDLDLDAQT